MTTANPAIERKERYNMRIVLLSDIHGNLIALNAVLADIQAQGGDWDALWILGDLAAIGYDPVGVIEHLSRLPDAAIISGNTEHYLATGQLPPPTFQEVQGSLKLLPVYTMVAQSFAWTQGAVTSAGWLDWLTALPLEQRIVLPDGTRVLGVHVSPGCEDGHGFHPALSEAEMATLLSGCKADLVCVGHTHWPTDVQIGDVRLVNPGSVSNPFPPDLQASYVVLEADEMGYRVKHRQVEYDRDAVIEAVHRLRHPAARYITKFMQGQNKPGWIRK